MTLERAPQRALALALAAGNCSRCHGLGLRDYCSRGAFRYCGCALRQAFRACLSLFLSASVRERNPRAHFSGISFSRHTEEYLADFWLAARRVLSEAAFGLFKLHFLKRQDWRACCGKLGIKNRGEFYHESYRVQERLGEAVIDRGLYPLGCYFNQARRDPMTVVRLESGQYVEQARLNHRYTPASLAA